MASRRDGGLKRSAIETLAYMGVRPSTPPQLELHDRIPTTTDSNFRIGTFWAVKDTNLVDILQLWVLLDINNHVATWEQLFPGGAGGGTVVGLRADDANIALPLVGIIDIDGSINITTTAALANTLTINLNNSIQLPNTTADGLNGVIFLGPSTFMHNFGTRNTFLGEDAGNLTNTSTDSVGIGTVALNALTTGDLNTAVGSSSGAGITTGARNTSVGAGSLAVNVSGSFNTAIGVASLASATASDSTAVGELALTNSVTGVNAAFGVEAGLTLTTGDSNTFLGTGAGQLLITGDDNIFIGTFAGGATVGAESNDIYIGNDGVAAEFNSIRIGNTQVYTNIAGIYNTVVPLPNQVMQIDATGQLGSSTGTDGQVLISDTGGSAAWANITAGAGISILNAANSITVTATGTASLIQVAFLAQNTPNLVNVTGNGTVYAFGAGQILTEIFDVGNNLTLGDGVGAPAVFTAPATAKYYLELTLNMTNLTGVGAGTSDVLVELITTARTYTWAFSAEGAFGSVVNPDGTFSFQQVVDMSLGDTATFQFSSQTAGGGGAQNVGLGVGSFISGFLVSGAGVGTVTLTANNGGSAMENAGNINVLGDTVNIESSVTAADELTFELVNFTDHAVPVGTAAGKLGNIPVGLTNQVLLGNTGADPSFGAVPNSALVDDSITFTAGAGIIIAGSPVVVPLGGAITITASGTGGGTAWNAVAGVTQLMVADNGYYTQNAGLTTLTLPALAAAGTVLEIAGVGAAGWTIAQNAGQNITFLDQATTIGVAGTLTPDNVTSGKSTIKLLCVVANTQWTVLSGNGNFTLV